MYFLYGALSPLVHTAYFGNANPSEHAVSVSFFLLVNSWCHCRYRRVRRKGNILFVFEQQADQIPVALTNRAFAICSRHTMYLRIFNKNVGVGIGRVQQDVHVLDRLWKLRINLLPLKLDACDPSRLLAVTWMLVFIHCGSALGRCCVRHEMPQEFL